MILRNFRKIRSMSASDIFPMNVDEAVAIGTLMFVEEAQRVEEFVKRSAKSVAPRTEAVFLVKKGLIFGLTYLGELTSYLAT